MLKKDEDVKRAVKEIMKNRKVDKEKKKLYQYRWLKKKGQLLRESEAR